MKQILFGNIGKKCKTVAVIVCAVGIVLSVLSGIGIMVGGKLVSNLFGGYSYGSMYRSSFNGIGIVAGLAVILVGTLLSWLASIQLYAAGEAAEKSNQVVNDLVEFRGYQAMSREEEPRKISLRMPKMPKVQIGKQHQNGAGSDVEREMKALREQFVSGEIGEEEYLGEKRRLDDQAFAIREAERMVEEKERIERENREKEIRRKADALQREQNERRTLEQLDGLLSCGLLSIEEYNAKRVALRNGTPAAGAYQKEQSVHLSAIGDKKEASKKNPRISNFGEPEVKEPEYSTVSAESVMPKNNSIKMKIVDGEGNVRVTEPFDSDEIIIGRVPAYADLVVNDRFISARHVRIRREHGEIYVMDLNSTNGTRINRCRIVAMQDTVLKPGDELSIGHSRIMVS